MQGDCAARKAMSFPRVMRLRNRTWPAASAPCLEHVLRDLQPDRANFRHGRLLFSGDQHPPLWHTKAVGGGVHPVPSAAFGKQKSYASQAGPPVGSDQPSTPCLEHHDGTCAPTGWPRRCPVGSRATERQYRDRQPSWRPVRSIGEDKMVEETIVWFASVDWGSAKHQACLLGAQGGIVGEREFPHSGRVCPSWPTGSFR